MTPPDHPTTQQPSRRGQALRISTVLAGLLHLALAALLVGIPSSSPTLDELPTPENHAAAPLPAVAARIQLTVSPTTSTTQPPRITTAPAITPTRKHSNHRPTAIPSPQRPTRPAVIRTTPARPTLVATTPTASHRPAPATSSPAKADEAPQLPPSSTPEPEVTSPHTPPGQTREPPGQVAKEQRAEHIEDTDIPPGQAKKPDG